jgi:AcrR family transcriptional regulator
MRSNFVKGDMEDLILDRADRLLARYGYRKMTMDDLATEVGIGKGTIYLHFRSKEDLVYAHIDRVIRRVIERLQRVLRSGLPPAEKIREMIVLRVMYRFDSVQHFPESLSEMFRDLRSGVSQRREHYFKEEAKLFAAALKEGQRLRIFRAADCSATANTIVAATNSLLPFHLSTHELGKRSDIEKMVTQIADLLLYGLLPRSVKWKGRRK